MEQDLLKQITVRPLKETEAGLVLSSMTNGLYYGCDFYQWIPKSIFYSAYKKIIEAIMDSDEFVKECIVLRSDPETVLAYAITKPVASSIVFVYTKPPFRHFGLASHLVDPELKYAAHLTKSAMGIMKNKTKIKYNPFVI